MTAPASADYIGVMFNELSKGFVTAAWIISAPFWVLDAALVFIAWVLWQIWKDGR